MGFPLNFEPQPGVYFVSNVGVSRNPDGSYSINPNANANTVGGASAATTRVNSTQYEASHVLKASAGSLVSLIGYNSSTSAGFIQIFDSATVPANNAVPAVLFGIPASFNFSLDVAVLGMPFANGITVVFSSTGPTLTIGTASVWFAAVVK